MGRQLATFGDISYTYNEEGIRTSKTSNGVTTKFLLDGYNVIEQSDGTTTLHFFYDSNGEVIGFRYDGNDYFYVKNARSDIIAITDSNKNIVAEYRYDPWGDILSTSGDTVIGSLNPFRYRSYYYDVETGFYYLQSRYYDPEVGRFINCDDVNYIGVTESAISYNPFAYCENEPINRKDSTGNYFISCFTQTWFVSLISLLVGSSIDYKKNLISFSKLGIKLYLDIICSTTFNPKSFFKINKSGLSMSAGGVTVTLGGGSQTISCGFSYLNTTTAMVFKLGKKSVGFGMSVTQGVSYNRGRVKLQLGWILMLEITYTALACMAATVVAVSYLVPQVAPFMMKIGAALKALYENPTILIPTGKVVLRGVKALAAI